MTESLRIVESSPLGASAGPASEPMSSLIPALLSTLDPQHLEAAFTSALVAVFKAEHCAILEGEPSSEARSRIAAEARARGEALSATGPVCVLCAPIRMGPAVQAAVILERGTPFAREELGLLAAIAPAAGLAFRNARLFERSSTDSLTRLPNRQRFVVELEAAVASPGPLNLVLLDLDHFKDKNEVYGRPVGDRALRELGELLRPLPIPAVARWGDDEFALLVRVDAAHARDFAEDVRRTIDDRIFDEKHEGIHVTASAGVAERRTGEMASALFTRAAEALAAAKRAGRNRVEMAR